MSSQTLLTVFAPSTSSSSYAGLPDAAAAIFAWPIVLIAAAVLMRTLRVRLARGKVHFVHSEGRSRSRDGIIRPAPVARAATLIPIRPRRK